jgi:hypothetical protein
MELPQNPTTKAFFSWVGTHCWNTVLCLSFEVDGDQKVLSLSRHGGDSIFLELIQELSEVGLFLELDD